MGIHIPQRTKESQGPEKPLSQAQEIGAELKHVVQLLKMRHGQGYSFEEIQESLQSMNIKDHMRLKGFLIDAVTTVRGVRSLLEKNEADPDELEWVVRSFLVRIHQVLVSSKHP